MPKVDTSLCCSRFLRVLRSTLNDKDVLPLRIEMGALPNMIDYLRKAYKNLPTVCSTLYLSAMSHWIRRIRTHLCLIGNETLNNINYRFNVAINFVALRKLPGVKYKSWCLLIEWKSANYFSAGELYILITRQWQ